MPNCVPSDKMLRRFRSWHQHLCTMNRQLHWRLHIISVVLPLLRILKFI